MLSLPDQALHASPQFVQLSASYTLPVVWQEAQKTVSPASIADWLGVVSLPQLGQLGAVDGRKRGVSTRAHNLQVNVVGAW